MNPDGSDARLRPGLDRLTTEARLPAADRLDQASSLELVTLMNDEDRRLAGVVAAQRERIAAAVDAVAARLRAGGRLVYAGAGTSGRIGLLDAVECPPTFSTPPGLVVGLLAGGAGAFAQAVEGAEDDPDLGRRDVAALRIDAADALVGISASGRTPYVLGALDEARARGAWTAGIACNDPAELAGHCDTFVPLVVGPEVIAGSTRLKAGTVTKMVLNMLSTGVMVALGKTFRNLMVDVAATNQKLRARAERIVADATGLAPDRAAAALASAGGEVKTAIVAALRRVDAAAARRLLTAAGGRVRDALAADSSA
jgi:N-acetylmuramic acid 6-phosphate etherase